MVNRLGSFLSSGHQVSRSSVYQVIVMSLGHQVIMSICMVFCLNMRPKLFLLQPNPNVLCFWPISIGSITRWAGMNSFPMRINVFSYFIQNMLVKTIFVNLMVFNNQINKTPTDCIFIQNGFIPIGEVSPFFWGGGQLLTLGLTFSVISFSILILNFLIPVPILQQIS